MSNLKIATVLSFGLYCYCLTNAALANDKLQIPVDPPKSTATADAAADADATGGAASASANGSQVLNVEDKRQAPATVAIAPDPTAPCRYAQGRSIGVPGLGGGWSQSKRDEDCWVEYLRQAEHQRALDLAEIELRRDELRIRQLELTKTVETEARK